MVARRRIDIHPLDVREQGSFANAVRRLEAIPLGGPPAAVFEALRACAPVVGGMIGVMGAEMGGAAISHVVGLPTDVLEGWATTPLADLRRMMAPLASAAPGALISADEGLSSPFREELALLRVIRSAGLGETAGYKIAASTTPAGRPEHRFLTIALDGGAAFTRRQRELFLLLQPAVAAAIARMAVPFVAHEPMFAQVIEESRIGYLCLSASGALVELNERAHELVFRYLGPAGIEAGRGCLQRFAERALIEASGGRGWSLFRPEQRTAAEIRVHRITKGTHEAGQDISLVMIRETEAVPGPALPAAEAEGLTSRQREIMRLLSTTSLTYKEIARELGIAEGTIRKHVERVYRSFGVQSRAGLTIRLR